MLLMVRTKAKKGGRRVDKVRARGLIATLIFVVISIAFSFGW